MTNAVLCKSCGNWIHGRRALVKMVTNILAINFKCWKGKGSHENVNQEDKFHDDVETVAFFLCLDDGINSGGRSEAVVTSRTRLGWVNFRDCQDLLCVKNSL